MTDILSAPAPLQTKILLVESNLAGRDMLIRRLERRGFAVCGAADGPTGVTLAVSEMPDVILMDINLPGISGITALRILADDPATAHIPVIALSANAIPRDIEKGLEAGFFRYLTKPIKVNEFMETLDIALERAKAQSERVHQMELAQ